MALSHLMARPVWTLLSTVCYDLAVALLFCLIWPVLWQLSNQWASRQIMRARLPSDSIIAWRQLFATAFAISLFALHLCGLPLSFALVGALATAYCLPMILLMRARRRRGIAFDAALVDGLTSIASSLRAGLTLRDSLDVAARNSMEPFASELQRALRDYRFGVSLDQSLDELRQRIQTENANVAFGSMIVSYKLGGNLPHILSRIAQTIRERSRVAGKLQSLTAQGRTQAWMLCMAPPVIGILMYLWDAEKFKMLTDTVPGQLMLALAITLEVIGIAVTRRILRLNI